MVAGCVGNVAGAADYERDHLAKLLAGNCLRFYGARLENALRLPGERAAALPAS